MKTSYLIILILMISDISSYAQNSISGTARGFFSKRDFGKYFISDMYAPISNIQLGMGLNLREYNISPDRTSRYVPYCEATIAIEIPIYKTTKAIKNSSNNAKFSISLPISVNFWWDFSEKATAPILNTDYRFGIVEFNYLREIYRGPVKNFSVKFLPLFHESTHLGDELTIYRIHDSIPITRVNVTYELADLSFTINDDNGRVENNHSFKLGSRFLLNPHKGWYTMRPIEGDTSLVDKSKRWMESYLQYQYQRPKGFLTGRKAVSVISLELRNRVKFGYPYKYTLNSLESIKNSEQHKLCFNGMAGWKFNSPLEKYPKLGVYLRYYAGINPHGQFRNMPHYEFIGVAIVYEN